MERNKLFEINSRILKGLALLRSLYFERDQLLKDSGYAGLPRPSIIVDKVAVREKDSPESLWTFPSLAAAYYHFTGRKRVMSWRDAPGAFRHLGLTVEKIEL